MLKSPTLQTHAERVYDHFAHSGKDNGQSTLICDDQDWLEIGHWEYT
jgi:hypothetical protein